MSYLGLLLPDGGAALQEKMGPFSIRLRSPMQFSWMVPVGKVALLPAAELARDILHMCVACCLKVLQVGIGVEWPE